MTFWQLGVGALMIVVNAFFVGAEFALISVRRDQIEPLAERGERGARTVLWALQHLSAEMATAQLGITASSLVLGAVAEPAMAHLLEPLFDAVGKTVVHVGASGSGQTVKAANQLIVAANIQALSEAVVFLEAYGVDTRRPSRCSAEDWRVRRC